MGDDGTDAIDAFARHVASTGFDDIPAQAIDKAKTFILDSFGVAIAGTTGPYVAELIEAARDWGAGDAASVWGHGARLPAPSAAMVNAYQTHNSEFDAIHEGAVVHAMASILAASMSDAERRGGVSGRALLEAIVLGCDVSCGIGLGATTGLSFFRPATAGAFGALAAIGKLSGLDAEGLVDGFGLLLGQISGTMQAHREGSAALGLQLGFCTRAAVMARDLAARGVTGPHDVLEGEFGYYALFEGGHDLAGVLPALGETWRIAEISHKPFPSGRASHGSIDALLCLRRQHGFGPEDVAHVLAEVTPLVLALTGRPMIDDPGPNYARLCIPYVGAVALLGDAVEVADFRADRLGDPDVAALARRIEVVATDNPDPNALVPQRITVRLEDGTEHTLDVETVIGHPDKPLTREQHLAKFRSNWQAGVNPLPEANGEALIEAIGRLEEIADCREIAALLTP